MIQPQALTASDSIHDLNAVHRHSILFELYLPALDTTEDENIHGGYETKH